VEEEEEVLNVPKEKIADPIELHGLSTAEQRWWRRPVYAGLKCATCKQVKSGAMYEYGVSEANGPIQWDGKVYCNTRCLPDDTKTIRREKYQVRQPKNENGLRKMQLMKARAQERLDRLKKRYGQLRAERVFSPLLKLADEEGVSKQAMHKLLRRAGVLGPSRQGKERKTA
jgi:hypothetical protein